MIASPSIESPFVGASVEYCGKTFTSIFPCYFYPAGWTAHFMSAHSYVSCTTTDDGIRTIKIALVNSMWVFSFAIALSVSGIMLENTSFLFVFCFTLGMAIMSSIYILVFIREIRTSDEIKHTSRCGAVIEGLRSLKEGMKQIVKKRPDNGRMHIILILTLMTINMFAVARELVFYFPYLKGFKPLER